MEFRGWGFWFPVAGRTFRKCTSPCTPPPLSSLLTIYRSSNSSPPRRCHPPKVQEQQREEAVLSAFASAALPVDDECWGRAKGDGPKVTEPNLRKSLVRDPLRGRFLSQNLSGLLPLIVLPLKNPTRDGFGQSAPLIKGVNLHSLNFGPWYGGVQNVWGEENVPENALSWKSLDPSERASGLLCRGFFYRKNRALTPEGGGKRTVRGGSKTPFWEGCHSWGFPPPSFFHPPMASSELSCGFLRKSAVFCENPALSKSLNFQEKGWICKNLRFSAKICALGFLCHLRSVTLSSPGNVLESPSRPLLIFFSLFFLIFLLSSSARNSLFLSVFLANYNSFVLGIWHRHKHRLSV